MPELWNAALLGAPYSILTYAVPKHLPKTAWAPGQRAAVPLGKRLACAMLLESCPVAPPGVKVRELLWPLDRTALLPPLTLSLVLELAKRNLATPGEILGMVLPHGLKQLNVRLCFSREHPRRHLALKDFNDLDLEERKRCADLWFRGQLELVPVKNQRREQVWTVTGDPPWPVRPGAVRQQEVLDHLWENGPMQGVVLRSRLGGWTGSVLKELETRGLVQKESAAETGETVSGSPCEPAVELKPSPGQEEAIARLGRALDAGISSTQLLFGVTGSGKSLVYFRLAQSCLERGRDVLLLAPEVALAQQLWCRACEFLPDHRPILYHGYLRPETREERFRSLSAGEAPALVVGTRSALFLPLSNPGLIVLDEEHDESFKQDEGFVYQAKEMAYYLMQQNKGLLVVGSATPDLKTYYAASTKRVPKISMQERIGGRALPDVHLVNLLSDPPRFGPFSAPCHKELTDTLDRGEQVIILLNRRGYAPLVSCVGCGEVARCPECEVGLTYHKKRERLLCHYCGLSRPFPLVCGKCGSSQYLPMGEGTEQVEEYLSATLKSETGLLRLDRDSVRRKGRMEDILDSFANHKAQILLGTQMLSKGHHFPGVTLVVVVDGDLGLNLPDYRATERTFQMLVQVSGRAGRGDRPGKVIIQTRNPDHHCWQFVRTNDYQGFYEKELELRRRLRYPPFVKLGLLRMSVPRDWDQGPQRIAQAAALIKARGRDFKTLQILGPAPAPLNQLKGRLRFHCLIKGEKWSDIRSACSELVLGSTSKDKLRVRLDLDPVQML